MPVALIAFLGKPLGKFAFWAVLALLLAGAAGGTWIAIVKHYEAKGAEQQRAAQEKRDAAWMKGAVENMNKVQAYYAPYVEALTKAENDRAAQLQEISRLSAANDSLPGLDASAVDRLRRLGPQRPNPLGSLGKPAGAAAR